MIALQARGPQLPDLSRQTAQYANMMNMARQQEAAQLQGQRARQEMEYAKAAEGRAVQTQTSAQKKADLEYIGLATKQFSEDVAKLKEGDLAGAEAVRADIIAKIPAWDKFIRPASEWTPEYITQIMSKASEIVAQTNPPAKSSIEYAAPNAFDAQGNPIPVGTPIQVITGRRPSATPILAAGGTATPPPTAPTAAPELAPSAGPVANGKYGEARFIPDNAVPLTDFEQEDIRRIKEGSGMNATGASFTRGGMGAATATEMTPERAQQIVDSAVRTRVMAQTDFDQLMAMAPEQNKQPFMEMIRANNITLQPSGMSQQSQFGANPVQTPQSQYADLRGPALQSQTAGLRGAPPMEQTMAQYIPVQRRDPNVSPAPGVYQVPTQDVAATSRATRPSKQEVFDTELAKIEAARKAGPAPLTPQQKRARQTEVAKAYTQTQSLINKTYDPKEGAIAVARKVKSLSDDQKKAITGLSNYVPSFRESTREADTLIANLKGVVTALGKDAAAASGAIGPMAVQEWKIVADQIANLDLAGMTPRALDAQMDRIIQQVSNATNLAQRVYDVQYSDDVKEYPAFKLRGTPPTRTKTPVAKGGTMISPDIDKILKSRGI